MGRALKVCGNGATPERPILSLTQLLDIRAEEQATKPAIHTVIPEDGDAWRIRTLNYEQLRKAIERLAWFYSAPSPAPDLRLPEQPNGSVPPPKTIGLFLQTSLNLTFTEFALHRLGLTSLLISPNNSAPAVASLLEKTGAHTLIYGERLAETAKAAQEVLKGKGYELELIPEKVFPLWGEGGVDDVEVERYPTRLTPEMEHERPCIILHSSGSTGFPKPLAGTHRTVIANGAMNWGLVGATLLPLFHGFGHHSTLRCISAAQPLSIFPAHLPLTAKNIVRFFDTVEEQTGVVLEQLFAVAYILKLLSEDDTACRRLAHFELVSFAGSAVPDEVGDKLTESGVKLLSLYGTTETGGVLSSLRDFDRDKAWNYLALPAGKSREYIKLVQHGTSESGVFEVVVTKGYPSLAIANQPDGSFATRDLFVFHPTLKGRLKYVGRLDDTLTQTLGEKTNPVPIELTIRGASEYVSQAIVFGDGKPFCGCLILPSGTAKDIASDRVALMEKIWPAIELANKDAPSHSQIVPEMVEFLPLDADVPLATKGTILRPSCYAAYKDLIERIYARYESGSSAAAKLALDPPALEAFLQRAIIETMGAPRAANLTRDIDLFRFGIDSLQAARVRTLCVRELDLGGKKPGENVVYDHPSIAKLAAHLYALRVGDEENAEVRTREQHELMRALVDKYAAYLVHHTPPDVPAAEPTGEVVVLTGATGALGAHILHRVLEDPGTARVVCLVRARDNAQATERVRESFKERMLPLCDIGDGLRVGAYASDLDRHDLGLNAELYSNLVQTATAVIHNAWAVNFNLGVASFEASHIRGAANLLNLCLRAPHARPARFYFSSSVSARQGAWAPRAAECITDDPACAAPTGYGRSKWVVESLCARAARERGVHCGVLRIGQMVGDSVNGVWNMTEAIPLLFRSAQVINALPDIDDYPSFLPIDIAACGIAEILRAGDRGPHAALYHIVNTAMTVSYSDVYTFLRAAGLSFSVIDRRAWVKRLAEGPTDLETNPTYKLLDFYRKRYGEPNVLKRSMLFEIEETGRVAPAIKAAPAISEELIRKWVERWREVGFLQ